MPQYLLMGDSNLFWLDQTCDEEPWKSIKKSEETTATFLCRLLDIPLIQYPIVKGIYLDWTNIMRLKSLITVMEDCVGSKHDIHLVLWIGQNAAFEAAQYYNTSDDLQAQLHQQVDSFVSKLTDIYAFSRIYVIGYHDHSEMAEYDRYMVACQYIMGRMLSKLPQAVFIPMLDTKDDMYEDKKHLKIEFQFEVAKHIFSFIKQRPC